MKTWELKVKNKIRERFIPLNHLRSWVTVRRICLAPPSSSAIHGSTTKDILSCHILRLFPRILVQVSILEFPQISMINKLSILSKQLCSPSDSVRIIMWCVVFCIRGIVSQGYKSICCCVIEYLGCGSMLSLINSSSLSSLEHINSPGHYKWYISPCAWLKNIEVKRRIFTLVQILKIEREERILRHGVGSISEFPPKYFHIGSSGQHINTFKVW